MTNPPSNLATLPEPDAAWRRENVGILLFAATRRCVRDKLRVVHGSGFATITDAQLALFHHLDDAGTRLTTLAARAGTTKQSMIELVDRADAAGLVTRAPDPADGRAKIVLLTPAGGTLRAVLDAAIRVAEAEVVQSVGTRFLADLKRALAAYLDASPADDAAEGGQDDASIARLFALSARRFAHNALGFAHGHGHLEVTEVLLALFRNLDLEGTRLTELAARALMTKQSMRELVDRAEALGFVARQPDPRDRRAKTILFTPAGRVMLEQMRLGIAQAEAHFAGVTGAAFVASLKPRLSAYIAGEDAPIATRSLRASAG